jgi:hypothetical protein
MSLPTESIHEIGIAVFVEQGIAAVAVNLNDKAVIRWKGRASRCEVGDPWPPGDLRGAILLGGWTGPTAFASAKVCSFSGRTRIQKRSPADP